MMTTNTLGTSSSSYRPQGATLHRRACCAQLNWQPTANFSPETTKAFQQLLPILNKVIPTIVIITPKSDERYEGVSEFTVVKVKGESQILAGHPNEHRKAK